jgi:hypothetical protein
MALEGVVAVVTGKTRRTNTAFSRSDTTRQR